MVVQRDVIYRVYQYSNQDIPNKLFVWDMIDFEVRKVLNNICRIFPDPPILASAMTCRLEDDEILCDFETLREIVNFEGDLNIYKLHLDLGEVKVLIENEDQFTLFFDDPEKLEMMVEFVTDQLEIPEIENYLFCLDEPGVYFCYDYYGRLVEKRTVLGEI